MAHVTVKSGTVVNGESRRLSVEIPKGMSGKRLQAWKAKNEKSICASIESCQLPAVIEASETEGDLHGRH